MAVDEASGSGPLDDPKLVIEIVGSSRGLVGGAASNVLLWIVLPGDYR
jgi:hypothetical protein